MEVDSLLQVIQLHKQGVYCRPSVYATTFICYFNNDARHPFIRVKTYQCNTLAFGSPIYLHRLFDDKTLWEDSLGFYHKGYCDIDLFDLLNRHLISSHVIGNDKTYATIILNYILNRYAGFNRLNPDQMKIFESCSDFQRFELGKIMHQDRDDVRQEELGVIYKSKINFKNKIRKFI